MKKDHKKVILQVENLKKYFSHNGVVNKAVDNVNFKVHEGEIVGLIGESGSGKTTVGRSLIRLYEDFSGIVTLDEQIISGKKITKSKSKFLRKNMQMIFQDPHASLNGQKNVFSILKEPLVVNKMISSQVKDILEDIDEIHHNFKYTFTEKFEQVTIDNLNNIVSDAKKLFKTWESRLQKLTFNTNSTETFEDQFNGYFGFLESKLKSESNTISSLYKNYEDLYDFFFEKQKDYRNKTNLDFDEFEIVNIKEKIKLYKTYQKQSKKQYLASKNRDLLKKQLEELENEKKEYWSNAQNLINGFANEFYAEYRLNLINAQLSKDVKTWYYYKKISLVNKLAQKTISDSWWTIISYFETLFKTPNSVLKYLTIDQIRHLIQSLKKYNEEYVKNHKQKNFDKGFEKKFIKDFRDHYDFSIKSYLNFAKENYDSYLDTKKKLLKKIHNHETTIKQPTADQNVDFSQKIANLEQDLIKAQKVFEQESEKYKLEFSKRHSQNLETITQLTKIWKEDIAQMQKNIFKLFDNKHQEFKQFALNTKLANGQTLATKEMIKEIDKKVKEKKESIDNFKQEMNLINHNYDDLKILFGLAPTNSWTKLFKKTTLKKKITNLILREKIFKSLEEVGLLKQFAYRYPHEFSGGQRQRIVIARALITNPKLIIADEPIASLDISIQAQIVNLLKDLGQKKNIGIVFIAHDLSMVEYIADKILIMHLGKIVEYGDTEPIYQNPIHPYTINLFDSIPKMSNANVPFKNINFDNKYLEEQRYPNEISYHKFSEHHFVLATDKQYKQWKDNNKKQ